MDQHDNTQSQMEESEIKRSLERNFFIVYTVRENTSDLYKQFSKQWIKN